MAKIASLLHVFSKSESSVLSALHTLTHYHQALMTALKIYSKLITGNY